MGKYLGEFYLWHEPPFVSLPDTAFRPRTYQSPRELANIVEGRFYLRAGFWVFENSSDADLARLIYG